MLAAVAATLAARGCDIREAEVYGDDETGGFFLRMALTSPIGRDALEKVIEPVATELALEWELHDLARCTPVLLAVSKFGHVLIDIIHKKETGTLPNEMVGRGSNHR